MSQVFLGLGSNLGDKYENLKQVLEMLDGRVGRLTAVSPIYQTSPFGIVNQPIFWNLCVKLETMLPPATLLKELKAIESEMGRVPTYHWGPRLIDLDILLYDDLILQTETLTIPHSGLTKRPFVLIPLHDIAPELVHPVSGKPIKKMVTAVFENGLQKLPIVLQP